MATKAKKIKDFEECVNGKIQKMKDLVYTPTRLIKSINELGAVEAIKKNMSKKTIPDGLLTLEDNNYRDLCMEYVVLDPQWKDIFEDRHRKEALRRLIKQDKDRRKRPKKA